MYFNYGRARARAVCCSRNVRTFVDRLTFEVPPKKQLLLPSVDDNPPCFMLKWVHYLRKE